MDPPLFAELPIVLPVPVSLPVPMLLVPLPVLPVPVVPLVLPLLYVLPGPVLEAFGFVLVDGDGLLVPLALLLPSAAVPPVPLDCA